MHFKGTVYNDGKGRLKVVIPNDIPRGRYLITITSVDGRRDSISFEATITKNSAATNKFRLKNLSINVRPGSTVLGWMRLAEDAPKKENVKNEETALRCKWCNTKVTATIDDLCDKCFMNINAPTPTPYRAYARGRVGHRPQAKHPNLRAASTAHNRGAPGIFSMERVSSGEGIPAGRVSPSREPLPEAAPEVKRWLARRNGLCLWSMFLKARINTCSTSSTRLWMSKT